ncbi:adenylyl-sulfate kinase [Pseudonocardia sp. HH130630-07]|uniref:adenylyl-sulfate kinase n=1 Tax=Pseudonocardia sp. HH130630-07 TaxID=1690815 RepID=UPI00081537E5|nr:adenylyl-sulfate kinase [Pseudonocardia sp. HH130630-07]ANY10530.1 adenylyl-sulfate kinase [Pseudonocardia sp. HH130630-07]
MFDGMTVLFTGLPSSGKSTIAGLVGQELRRAGRPNQLLDGDVVRRDLCSDLGFSAVDRQENLRRVGFVAAMLARHGVVALVPMIAPYRADRSALRARHASQDLRYYEVHVAAPLEVCTMRDVKGLYREYALGKLTGLTGVDDPYEVPESPELVLATGEETIAACARSVLDLLGATAVDLSANSREHG